ncbi:hypothetical protein E2562_015579 [Oryza meyeriana var. granulata]|uniref:Uncharacterized protein n=1 Tax=Oryza meyeriana var. granulata TaxID=110450 RepID=A0A6G1EK07_9ORYZ|nr:hypothetical protein E2562_015579 [Oryza meyeriana var. granulata]
MKAVLMCSTATATTGHSGIRDWGAEQAQRRGPRGGNVLGAAHRRRGDRWQRTPRGTRAEGDEEERQ